MKLNFRIWILVYGIWLASFSSFAQNKHTVDLLQSSYQSCLDTGANMSDCALTFYIQMDSLLNVTYTRLRAKLNPAKKATLKKEQKAWLQKRDQYLRKTNREAMKNGGLNMPISQDERMMMYDKNAIFVKARVLKLVSALNL
ncbi:MAG: lysozyme inhibitor LprI family protein [Bacteroidales bacterium]|nr:lysozyme inhibitor LprI family protein [Bacteroidales bacterium]